MNNSTKCELIGPKKMTAMASILAFGAVLYLFLLFFLIYFWKTVVHNTDP